MYEINKNGVTPVDWIMYNDLSPTQDLTNKSKVVNQRFKRTIRRLTKFAAKHKYFYGDENDLVMGSLIFDLTGSQFGSNILDLDPEMQYLADVINFLDCDVFVTEDILKHFLRKAEGLSQNLSLFTQIFKGI